MIIRAGLKIRLVECATDLPLVFFLYKSSHIFYTYGYKEDTMPSTMKSYGTVNKKKPKKNKKFRISMDSYNNKASKYKKQKRST